MSQIVKNLLGMAAAALLFAIAFRLLFTPVYQIAAAGNRAYRLNTVTGEVHWVDKEHGFGLVAVPVKFPANSEQAEKLRTAVIEKQTEDLLSRTAR